MKKVPDQAIVFLSEALQGTCDVNEDEELRNILVSQFGWKEEEAEDIEFYNLPIEQLHEFDTLLFRCEMCGWFCETSEMSETDQVCDQCFDPEEDEE